MFFIQKRSKRKRKRQQPQSENDGDQPLEHNYEEVKDQGVQGSKINSGSERRRFPIQNNYPTNYYGNGFAHGPMINYNQEQYAYNQYMHDMHRMQANYMNPAYNQRGQVIGINRGGQPIYNVNSEPIIIQESDPKNKSPINYVNVMNGEHQRNPPFEYKNREAYNLDTSYQASEFSDMEALVKPKKIVEEHQNNIIKKPLTIRKPELKASNPNNEKEYLEYKIKKNGKEEVISLDTLRSKSNDGEDVNSNNKDVVLLKDRENNTINLDSDGLTEVNLLVKNINRQIPDSTIPIDILETINEKFSKETEQNVQPLSHHRGDSGQNESSQNLSPLAGREKFQGNSNKPKMTKDEKAKDRLNPDKTVHSNDRPVIEAKKPTMNPEEYPSQEQSSKDKPEVKQPSNNTQGSSNSLANRKTGLKVVIPNNNKQQEATTQQSNPIFKTVDMSQKSHEIPNEPNMIQTLPRILDETHKNNQIFTQHLTELSKIDLNSKMLSKYGKSLNKF